MESKMSWQSMSKSLTFLRVHFLQKIISKFHGGFWAGEAHVYTVLLLKTYWRMMSWKTEITCSPHGIPVPCVFLLFPIPLPSCPPPSLTSSFSLYTQCLCWLFYVVALSQSFRLDSFFQNMRSCMGSTNDLVNYIE